MNTLQARDFYSELGIDAIPLRPDDKLPLYDAWQKKEPRRMWTIAPQNANIGLRGGGEIGAAFLDCDEDKKPGTFDNVTNFLRGLGVTEYPLIQSASQVGRHIYLTVTDAPQGNYCKLAKTTGKGEFRFGPGAFIVAAPSVVEGRFYSVLSGEFDHIPNVSFADLRPILGETVNDWQPSPTVPRNAFAILNGDGDAIAKFDNDRSRAEQSLLLSLANAGFSFADVLQLFNNNPCAGKYAELRSKNAKSAERWLSHSFTKAQADARKDSKERETALRAIAWAKSRAWTGKGGASEQAVFLAHMAIAYKAGTVTGWAAGKRTLAELAGVAEASKVNKRLLLAGYLNLERRFTVDCANIFSLSTTLPLPKNVVCEEVVTLCNDAFRLSKRRDGQAERMASGQIGRQLWEALRSVPMNAEDLAHVTGRDPRTVKKYLERMRTLKNQMTGEILPMVELKPTAEGEKWHALTVDFEAVAKAVGTHGKGSAQRLKHAKERRRHARQLMTGEKR
jgi:hypothetical protein